MADRREIRLPAIGDFEQVEVVEVLVKPGDRIAIDDPLVSIESEKATMEIPSPAAGVVVELAVKEGDKVSEGSLLAVLEIAETAKSTGRAPVAEVASPPIPEKAAPVKPLAGKKLSPAAANPVPDRTGLPHASPLVRRFARELGVPVAETPATGPHGRVLIEDVKTKVRERFTAEGGQSAPEAGATATAGASAGTGAGTGIPPVPFIDPARFGPVHDQALTRIQKVSGPALHRSWLNVPHVTQHDEADITELERFRRDRKDLATAKGVKLSPLLFVMKAVVIALREHPTLRSTLSPERDRLLVKDYFHLGIAVDTDQGLVVPVVRDVDRKGVFELAAELQALATRARNRKLGPDDLAGACFTISSLGGIGGTAFSPIVNAPEVAILGLSKTRVAPLWRGPSPLDLPPSGEGGRFEPRLVLPLSLSYDHRVVDGALAVRFTTRLAAILADPMQLLL